MQWWFRGFVDRLAFRLMSVLSAKVEAQLELELADVRAQLLHRADDYGAQAAIGLTAVAQTLTESSTRLGQSDYLPAANEQVALARLVEEHRERTPEREPQNGVALPHAHAASKPTPTPKRGRGRPPKDAGKPTVSRIEGEVVPADTQTGGPADGQ